MGATGVTRRCTPSRTCLPIKSSAGKAMGYSPSKQARQSLVLGCSVAAISPSKET